MKFSIIPSERMKNKKLPHYTYNFQKGFRKSKKTTTFAGSFYDNADKNKNNRRRR